MAKERREPNFDKEPTLRYQGENYFSFGDACIYAGISRQGLLLKIKAWNEKHPASEEIAKMQLGTDAKRVYYKVSDMRRLVQPVVKQ